METRPNHTVYINNLNEKVKKEGEFQHPAVPGFSCLFWGAWVLWVVWPLGSGEIANFRITKVGKLSNVA